MERTESNFEAALPNEHFKEVLRLNTRPDGRDLSEFRKMTVNVGSIETADGSSLVQMGHTMVVCGIKAELTRPPASHPLEGIIIPNVELPPLSASHFKPGPPSEQAQFASQLLDNILKTPDLIDLEKLCVFKDKLVWVLYCDLVCLSYDGNLNDAIIMALSAALGNTTIPVIEYDDSNGTVKYEKTPFPRKSLPINKRLVSSTFSQFESTHIITDPTLKEEQITAGEMTIVTDENGVMCHLHRPGGFPLKEKVLNQCVKRAVENGKKLQALLNEFYSDA